MGYVLFFILAAGLLWGAVEIKRLKRKAAALAEEHKTLWKMYKDAAGLIDAHAEAEAEAAKSERLFQEGLNNILNYGVKSSG